MVTKYDFNSTPGTNQNPFVSFVITSPTTIFTDLRCLLQRLFVKLTDTSHIGKIDHRGIENKAREKLLINCGTAVGHLYLGALGVGSGSWENRVCAGR